MKNILTIVIQKNKQQTVFYVEEQAMSFANLLLLCKTKNITLCHVQTFEGAKKLVDCYLPFHDEAAFRQRLIKAAKAKS